MILKNDIPWPRVLAEAAAIVAGILMAFAIDAWWQERQERIEEQQILAGLEIEFQSIRDILAEHAREHRKNVRALEAVLDEVSNGPSENSLEIIEASFLELLSPTTSDVGTGTLEALLSSGRIEIIENRRLRSLLAGWNGVISELWDDQAFHAKSVIDTYIPYFAFAEVPAGAAMRHWYAEWNAPVVTIADTPGGIERLLADDRFRILVEIRYGYQKHTGQEFDYVMSGVDAILAEIRASRD